MVANKISTKQRIMTLLESLPEEALTEVASFMEYQRFKMEQRSIQSQRPTPVKLDGLWEGIDITDDEIAAMRRDMWGGIEGRFS